MAHIESHDDPDLFVGWQPDFWDKIYCPEDAHAIFGIKTTKDIADGGVFFYTKEYWPNRGSVFPNRFKIIAFGQLE